MTAVSVTYTAAAVIQSLSLAVLIAGRGVTATQPKVCRITNSVLLTHIAMEPSMTVLGHICPQSHPIPCHGGNMCTSRARAMEANYCRANDIVNGACCPEDAVPCNFNKPELRCMENPKYGVVEYLPALTQFLT